MYVLPLLGWQLQPEVVCVDAADAQKDGEEGGAEGAKPEVGCERANGVFVWMQLEVVCGCERANGVFVWMQLEVVCVGVSEQMVFLCGSS